MAIPRDRKEAEEFANRALQPWRLALLMNDKGSPRTCLANALIVFRLHPEWSGILAFDTFQQRAYLRGKLPWREQIENRPWSPHDDILAADWLQHVGVMLAPKSVAEAIEAASRDNQFHPIIDYLATLQWDG